MIFKTTVVNESTKPTDLVSGSVKDTVLGRFVLTAVDRKCNEPISLISFN